MLPTLTAPASARGPDGIADVAERVIDAVVNISTSQNVASRNQGGGGGGGAMPNLPNDPQLDELFRVQARERSCALRFLHRPVARIHVQLLCRAA